MSDKMVPMHNFCYLHVAKTFSPCMPVVPVTIIIDRQQPDDTDAAIDVLANDAQRLADALYGVLPGRTLDQLLIELMRRRASQLAGRFKEDT